MLDLEPATLVARAIVLIFAFTFHELAHALVADYFGDITPRMQGRITLNPLAHLDFVGSLLILFAGFGWAKPVQINPHFLRQRSRYAVLLVAVAGPLANLALAVIGGLFFKFGIAELSFSDNVYFPSFNDLMAEFVWLNLVLMLFNLIPLFPLDGEKIAMDLLPPSLQDALDQVRPYSSFILIAIVFLVPQVLREIIFRPAQLLFFFLT